MRTVIVNEEEFQIPETYGMVEFPPDTVELCEVLHTDCKCVDCKKCLYDRNNFDAWAEYMSKGEDK